MKNNTYSKWIASCCLTALVALYVVGAVSHGSLRHEVQTLPLWAPIVLGFRGQDMAKWSALGCLAVWLLLMLMIWSFLAGWTHLLSGHFSPVEIGLTIVIATACVCGIAMSMRWRTAMGRLAAFGTFVLFVGLQLVAVRLSFLPHIANQ
jgi:hypothetical protein